MTVTALKEAVTSNPVESAPTVDRECSRVAALIGIDTNTGNSVDRKSADYTNGLKQADSAEHQDAEKLPLLRSELRLEPAQFDRNGQPRWTLHDPIKRKFYRLGWLEFELLSRWQGACVDVLLRRVNAETTLRVNRGHIDNLSTMLRNNELVRPESPEDFQKLKSGVFSQKLPVWKRAFKASMFYRKPLVNPDRFLSLLHRLASPLFRFRRTVLALWAVLAAVAVYGVGAHWFEFRTTFTQFMTIEGFVLFGLVLLVTNTLHEIGHGLMARHYNCRVTEMGVAMIFMLPVCYCDTSDTWRLTTQWQRLLVSAGGLLMELALATVACLLWLYLPDGIPRTLAFFLAVTSLATTLFVNLNPFMKFDGYYLLADFLAVDNLQVKSFSNFRWQLRRWFVGTAEQKPYRVPEASHAALNLYACCTWIYRLLLYFSICWMVYQFWFKALGLVLMAGVFITMIVTPVVKESAAYAEVIGQQGLSLRRLVFLFSLLVVLALLLVPLPRNVSAPAVLGSQSTEKLYATGAARISDVLVAEGDSVKAGQMMLTLDDPALSYQRSELLTQVASLEKQKQLETQWLSDDHTTMVSQLDIDVAKASLAEVQQKIDLLQLNTTDDAIVTFLPAWIKPGVWVDTNTVLAELASRDRVEVRAYVPAVKRDLVDGEKAMFYPGTGAQPVDLKIASISDSNIELLEDRALSVGNGGQVAVDQRPGSEFKPLQGWGLAVLSPVDSELVISSEATGYVMFSAKAKSLMSSALDRLYGVLIRESGF